MKAVMRFYWFLVALVMTFAIAVRADLFLAQSRKPVSREAIGYTTCSVYNVGGLLNCKRY